MRFKDGWPSAISTPLRTQTCVVSTTLDLTSLRKFFLSIEEADMEGLLALFVFMQRPIDFCISPKKQAWLGMAWTGRECAMSAFVPSLVITEQPAATILIHVATGCA
jgi:hypothetical protein